MSFLLSKTKKSMPFFFHWGDSSFYEKLPIDLLGTLKKIFKHTLSLSSNLVNPYKLVAEVLSSLKKRENLSKSFFHWKKSLFSKRCVFATFYVLKKIKFNYHNIIHNAFWNQTSFSLRFIILGNTGEKRPKPFVTGWIAFFDMLVSNDLLVPKKIKLLTCTKLSKFLVHSYRLFFGVCSSL